MSESVVVALDVGVGDLRQLDPLGTLAREIGHGYCACMAGEFGLHRAGVPVAPDPIVELGLVRLAGPWLGSSWLGDKTFVMNTMVKWGVFFSVAEERAIIGKDALCLAKTLGASRILLFNSGERAFDVATEGADFSNVQRALGEGARHVAVRMRAREFIDAFVENIIDEDRVDNASFVISLVDLR